MQSVRPMQRRFGSACAGILLSLLAGCADDPGDTVRVDGNVVSVAAKPATAKADSPANGLAAFGRWLRGPWTRAAIAQSSCGAAVEGVLACLASQSASFEFRAACSRVRSNCEFEVELELAGDGDELVLFFCADVNGDAVCDPEEPAAPYFDFGKVGSFCNGDVLTVTNVAVDFGSGTCSGSPSTVVADGCGVTEPTTIPAQPTRTARPGSTPRPGETPAPPSPTLAPGETPQPTQTAAPAPTGTPSPRPTVRPTPPEDPCVPHLLPCSPNGNGCCNETDTCSGGFCGSFGQCNAQIGDDCSSEDRCCEGICQGACCRPNGEPCSGGGECCGFCNDSTFTCQSAN